MKRAILGLFLVFYTLSAHALGYFPNVPSDAQLCQMPKYQYYAIQDPTIVANPIGVIRIGDNHFAFVAVDEINESTVNGSGLSDYRFTHLGTRNILCAPQVPGDQDAL